MPFASHWEGAVSAWIEVVGVVESLQLHHRFLGDSPVFVAGAPRRLVMNNDDLTFFRLADVHVEA